MNDGFNECCLPHLFEPELPNCPPPLHESSTTDDQLLLNSVKSQLWAAAQQCGDRGISDCAFSLGVDGCRPADIPHFDATGDDSSSEASLQAWRLIYRIIPRFLPSLKNQVLIQKKMQQTQQMQEAMPYLARRFDESRFSSSSSSSSDDQSTGPSAFEKRAASLAAAEQRSTHHHGEKPTHTTCAPDPPPDHDAPLHHSPSSWECAVCTFINMDPMHLQCGMCGNVRQQPET